MPQSGRATLILRCPQGICFSVVPTGGPAVVGVGVLFPVMWLRAVSDITAWVNTRCPLRRQIIVCSVPGS